MKICNLFSDYKDVRWHIGLLDWREKTEHAMVGLDLAEFVPLIRRFEGEELYAAGVPFSSISNPPYIEPGDIQYGRKERKKIGRIYTESDHRNPIYQVRFLPEKCRKIYDCVFLHIHIETGRNNNE